jgi:hypothetical protein
LLKEKRGVVKHCFSWFGNLIDTDFRILHLAFGPNQKKKKKLAKAKLILTFAVPTKRELPNGVC